MIEQLREDLEEDEGCMYVLYLDHLKLKTCGVGHLVRADDPEFDMDVGDPVSEERVAELFEKDIGWTISDCQKLVPDFDMLPTECRLILSNMMYNMGLNRMSRFLRLLAAVEERRWEKAADEMLDSKWATQVPARSGRLIARMRALA